MFPHAFFWLTCKYFWCVGMSSLEAFLGELIEENKNALFFFGDLDFCKKVIFDFCCFARALLRPGQIQLYVPLKISILKCPMAFVAGGFSAVVFACPRLGLDLLAEGHEEWFPFIRIFQTFEVHFCVLGSPQGSPGSRWVFSKLRKLPEGSPASPGYLGSRFNLFNLWSSHYCPRGPPEILWYPRNRFVFGSACF